MDIDRILNFSSNAGKAMLQSGGETYRVEETIARICQSFGIDHVDVFATPTAVMASVFVDGKLHSAIKRISSRRVDLNLVHEVNSLSRAISINNLDIELCEKILDEISEDNYYSDLITIFFAGIAAATFSILFGGNVEEFIAAFTVGILTKFVIMYLSKSSLNDFCKCNWSSYYSFLFNFNFKARIHKDVRPFNSRSNNALSSRACFD